MRKTYLILLFLASSFVWGQKEIPDLGSSLETIGDERLNGQKVQSIDAGIVQQVRMMKANKEKAMMKKQILSGQKVDKKTFKVAQQESKFLAIKEIIETIKSEKSELIIKKKIDFNVSGLKNKNEAPNLYLKNNSGK